MKSKQTETKSLRIAIDDNHRHSVNNAPGVTTGNVATTGRSKGESIGGAIGHGFGVGTDTASAAVKGAIAAGKCDSIEAFNPVAEHEFWRKEFVRRPYFPHGTSYDHYGPAYQFGWESHANHKGDTFEDIESQLGRDWELRRGKSMLSWNNAKRATHDAWQRAEKASCGDSCSSA